MTETTPPIMADEGSFLLTVDEIAAQLRVTRMTIYRQIKAGRLGALRVGNSYRVPEAEFAAYKKRNTTEAVPYGTNL